MAAPTIPRSQESIEPPPPSGAPAPEPSGRSEPPEPQTANPVDVEPEVDRVGLADVGRPLLAAFLAAAAAALVTGGIFGTWSARLLALAAAGFGVGWAFLALRSPERRTTYQLLLLPAGLAVSLVLLVPAGGGGPSQLPTLIGDAVASGRTLRPPVPFDPGWIPILVAVFSLVGFGAAWVGTVLDRQRLAIAVPLPLLALTAMTQPDDGQFIAGLCAFVPLVGALAVLFGGDGVKASQLTKDFELKRAARGAAATVAAVLALFVLGRANVLFPEPVYDPTEQPQKPKPIPLSEIQDVVLFEVRTDAGITGPWKTGVLDVYDGEAWRLPPFDKARLAPVPADGIVRPDLAPGASSVVEFTVRGLSNATTLPGPTGPVRIERPAELDGVRFDSRTDTFRLEEGRVPADVTYRVATVPYPNAAALAAAPAPEGDFALTLEVPPAPDAIRPLLSAAPAEPAWARMDFLRKRLRDVAVATGGGVPKDITPSRVVEILDGPTHEASPYEIVAAEAMLARWAGVPSRIGFGFDGLNDEGGVFTVRPRNAAQWLEVYFQGHGWVPLIEAPNQAKASLDNDDQVFDPDTLASDEVAVEVYVPVKLESLQLLYQRIRQQLVLLLPYGALLAFAYLATPAAMKLWRRQKRRRWAEALGPRAQVAVEYAEFRDQAHDLNLGDPLDTPLEYLQRVVDDDEHAELAWLVSRVMYGDLAASATDDAARDAEELAGSLRRRMFRAQPYQVRLLAVLSKASLRQPYTEEVPNVVLLDPLGRLAAWRRRSRLARRGAGRRRLHLPALRPRRLAWRRS
jgi:transglutaminase-like putative cysteine protease